MYHYSKEVSESYIKNDSVYLIGQLCYDLGLFAECCVLLKILVPNCVDFMKTIYSTIF